MGVAREALI